LSLESGKEISKIMSPWTTKIGFPILTVTETETGINVRQNRYLQSTLSTSFEDDEVIYPVFLNLNTSSGLKDILMTTRTLNVPLDDHDRSFYKLNTDQTGLYRVLYPASRLSKIGQSTDRLSVPDRIGLVSDSTSLSISGHQKTSSLLALLQLMAKAEGDPFVWNEIIATLTVIEQAWQWQPHHSKNRFFAYRLTLLSPRIRTLGWEFQKGEPDLLQTHKSTLFLAAGLAGDEQVVSAAREMFAKYISGEKSAIHANMRRAVFIISVYHGEETDFDTLLKLFKSSTVVDENEDALRALGATRHAACIQNLLSLLLTSDIKTTELTRPLVLLATHPEGISHLWAWAKKHWKALEEKLGTSLGMLGALASLVTRGVGTREALDDIRSFYEGRDGAFQRKLGQSLEKIDGKIRWLERDSVDVDEWLESNGFV
jgi:aminopeptidase 2